MKIQTNLLAAFAAVIVSLVSVFSLFFFIGNSVRDGYKHTIDNIIREYSVIDISDKLVRDYTGLLQNSQDTVLSARYSTDVSELNAVFSSLEGMPRTDANKMLFNRLRNNGGLLREYLDLGIVKAKQQDFSRTTEILDQINRTNESMHADATNLILTDLSISKSKQSQNRMVEMVVMAIGIVVSFAAVVWSIWYAKRIAENISSPMVGLSKLTQDIAGGNLDLNVNETLLNRKDEIGSLASSFQSMVMKLRGNITELKRSNEEMSEAKAKLEKINGELEEMNKFMVGRELTMIELKKQMAELRAKLSSS